VSISHEDELYDELEDRAAHPPRAWNPEGKLSDDDQDTIKDQSVAGIVDEIDDRDHPDFGPWRMVTLRRRDGSRVNVAMIGAVLKNRAKSLEIGDGLAITYKGRVKPKAEGYSDYADYDVIHRKPRAGPRPVTIEEDEPPPSDEDAPEEVGA
jgi:hypothetical protein